MTRASPVAIGGNRSLALAARCGLPGHRLGNCGHTVAATVAPRAYGGPEVALWSVLLGGLVSALLAAAIAYYLARPPRGKKAVL